MKLMKEWSPFALTGLDWSKFSNDLLELSPWPGIKFSLLCWIWVNLSELEAVCPVLWALLVSAALFTEVVISTRRVSAGSP